MIPVRHQLRVRFGDGREYVTQFYSFDNLIQALPSFVGRGHEVLEVHRLVEVPTPLEEAEESRLRQAIQELSRS